MLGRKPAGEDRGVRRQGERRGGARVLEEDPFVREPIEGGRARVRVAVRANPIGARRVQRDDDEVQRAAVNAAR